jgi:hypothetical protein
VRIIKPAGTITSLTPNTVILGGAAFTLSVTGSDFNSASVVRWNGQDRPTTYLSTGSLSATIPASDITATGTVTVTVYNSLAGGGTSNGLTLTIANPAPGPLSLGVAAVGAGAPGVPVTSAAPPELMEGSSAFTLVVGGAKFVSGAVVRWEGQDRPTRFVNASQLVADITAADGLSRRSARLRPW